MQGNKPKKTFTMSYKAIDALKRLSAGNESFIVEKLILEEDERRKQETEKAKAS